MYVIKRDGRQEQVHFDKITSRISKLAYGLNPDFCDPVRVDVTRTPPNRHATHTRGHAHALTRPRTRRTSAQVLVAQKVTAGVYKGVTTCELDELAAETAASMTAKHPDYATLAARIAVSNLHKSTSKSFSETVKRMRMYSNPKNGQEAPLVSESFYKAVMENADRLDSEIIYDRDFHYDYFGFKTLERSYLLRIDGKIVERPQHMLMRVAIGIHENDVEQALRTYHLMSGRWFTHASPTLFNAGTPRPQLSSCFLLCMKDDSIDGIYDTLKQCAVISKSAGGIGLSVHNIRATGSYIRGTNGTSNGIVPMLRVFNDTARYVDQGGGKRKGAFAVYIEPWHADIFEFLDLRKNHGKEEVRARDLFYGLWTNDLFMERVEAGAMWSLFCPNEAPGLAEVYGDEFKELYEKYEAEGRYMRQVKAQELWFAILTAQVETGNPYMLFKDSINKKSNQKNLGTIKSSNLCTEIVEYTAPDETAVCNLASIALPRFVREVDDTSVDAGSTTAAGSGSADPGSPTTPVSTTRREEQQGQKQRLKLLGSLGSKRRFFDHAKLKEVTKQVTYNLNRIIDINYYPTPECSNSNLRHRPIGLGVQGLADALITLGLPFDSEEARQLNKEIFETIYFSALECSCELAAKHGPYSTYEGSPASQGILSHDMWGVKPPSTRHDWDGLRASIKAHGLRNSLLVAPMPTASTSQILGNNECFEPYTSNIYVRRVLSGEFTVVNTHLLTDLVELGLWGPELKNELVASNGSVANIEGIPESIKAVYRTVWEIKQRSVIDMAADRGAFIDQSQSLNVHMSDPNFGKLTSLHFHAWRSGLKTGMYYLRTRAAADAIKFTVDQASLAKKRSNKAAEQPRAENKENSSSGGNGGGLATPQTPAAAAKEAKSEEDREAEMAKMICSLENKEACLMCGS